MDINAPIISKRLFLFDAFGAMVSAFFLGVVLVRFNNLVGMPIRTLYILAALPCFFALYSFYCYFLIKDNWRPFLKAIAIANLTYCCITLGLVIYYFQSLTFLGLGYFVLEIIVIGILVAVELKTASKTK